MRPIIGILWPPAQLWFEKILEDISCCVTIKNITNISIKKNNFRNFVCRVYDTDDTNQSQIEKKIKRMTEADPCKICVIEMLYEHPDFIIKRFGHTISEYGIRMKEDIREKYRINIPDYVYDVIIHTADNYDQTEELKNVIKDYIK